MNDGGWLGRRGQPRKGRSFLLYALGTVGTFAMAARAVHWFDGQAWLALMFLAVGLSLAGYYLVRLLSNVPAGRGRKR